jgi:type VI protein secretion system component Hcp
MPGVAKSKTIFMKLVDPKGSLVVRGEVSDKGFEGAIELQSMQLDRPGIGGGGLGTGRRGEITISSASGTKFADTTTPLLMQMLITGRPSPINAEVFLIFVGNALFPASTTKIILQKAFFTGYSIGGAGMTDGVLIDSFSLNFEGASFEQLAQNDQTPSVRSRLDSFNAIA